MSHALTPSPVYTGSVTVPDSGDPRTAASVETPFQTLADWSVFAVNGVASRLQWAEELSVDPGGSNSSFSINVGAIQTAVLTRVDGSYRALSAVAATIGASKLESGSTLANSTWYYVYCWDNAGTLDYQISTTAPRASMAYKNTAGNVYRYLGCFRTNSIGAPIPMRARRGRYVYRLSATTDPQAYSDSTARGSAYDVSLAGLVPPHARMARLQAIVTSSGASTFMNVFTKADVTDITWRQQSPASLTTYGEFDIETDSSQVVQITYNVGGGSGNAALRVVGFSE